MEVSKQAEEKIANSKLTSTSKSTNSSSLQDPQVKKTLQDIHNNSVINPIDKANGNAAIICKRIYALTLIKKPWLNVASNDHETYKYCDQIKKDQIIQRHSQYLQDNFKLDVTQNNKQLPII